jgi:acyl-CoA synthetase (AMP-forming)/AMP-acid ligase II
MTEETRPPAFIDHLDHLAEAIPDAPALDFRGHTRSWAGLRERARRHAAGQRAAGLAPGDRLGYLGKNHPACLEAVYGSRYAGTVTAILNWRLAPDEIAYAANDAGVKLLFVSADLAPALEEVRAKIPTLETVVVVDDAGPRGYETWLNGHAPAEGRGAPDPGAGWIQLYTSGTTGFPKGAVLTYEGISAHSEALQACFAFTPESVSMVAMPLYHVGGICWFMVGAALGARSLVIEDAVPGPLLDDIAKHRVTHTFFVPALFGFFMQLPDIRERDLSSLEQVIYGASPMPLPLLKQTLEVFHCNIWQVYGMTEMSGVVTILDPESHRDSALEHRLVSAGRPLPSAEIRVVRPGTAEDADVREMGEIWVRSRQRMLGYHGKPEATAAAFEGDWLKSGDAGFFDADGYLYVSDRIKDMIISGGENIYPAEVERVLVEHPAVREAAVIGVPSDRWGETVRAVVALREKGAADAEALIAHCRARLAHYKCPTGVEFVEALPRNATGKVLKRDLRAPFWEDRDRRLV